MRARIFAEESKKWWTLGAVAFGLCDPRAVEQFVDGFQAALLVAAAIAFAGALVAVATVRKYQHAEAPLAEAAA